MREFSDYFKVILKHEGGFVNNPSDPGGSTEYGISLLFLKGLDLADGDVDHDGTIDADDIKALTVDEASILYQKYFWTPMNLDGIIDEDLKLNLFDQGVNSGTRTAIKILQRLLNLQDDGAIGPNTTNATNSYSGDIIADYKTARENYYLAIIQRNPKLMVFKTGWFNRIESTNFDS
jgi:lysozyme family protein